MFDSVSGGYIPLALLAGLVGAVVGVLTRSWIALIIPPVVAVLACYLWFWFPIWTGITSLSESAAGWDLVATAFWSVAAVPASIVAFIVVRVLRLRARTA